MPSCHVSRESLNCTAGLDAIGEVNLEKALTLAEEAWLAATEAFELAGAASEAGP